MRAKSTETSSSKRVQARTCYALDSSSSVYHVDFTSNGDDDDATVDDDEIREPILHRQINFTVGFSDTDESLEVTMMHIPARGKQV